MRVSPVRLQQRNAKTTRMHLCLDYILYLYAKNSAVMSTILGRHRLPTLFSYSEQQLNAPQVSGSMETRAIRRRYSSSQTSRRAWRAVVSVTSSTIDVRPPILFLHDAIISFLTFTVNVTNYRIVCFDEIPCRLFPPTRIRTKVTMQSSGARTASTRREHFPG